MTSITKQNAENTIMVCIDSNALTYLVEAMTDGGMPQGTLAKEKVALFRIFLYRGDCLYIAPFAKSESLKIKDSTRLLNHREVAGILLCDINLADTSLIDSRVKEYIRIHPCEADCRILAESELGGGDIFLTYDIAILKRLAGKTHHIQLFRPSEFWDRLKIPKGFRPSLIPHPSNPRSVESWWVW